MFDLTPIWLSLELAVITTILLLIIGIPLAAWLAHTKWKSKVVLEVLIAMPLVMPPSVLGFYLLMAFTPKFGLGKFLLEHLDIQLVFSFSGLVLASMVYSLPFMVQPIQAGLSNLSPELRHASYALGKSKWQTLFRVLLPNIQSAILTGIVLTFAHTIGEFGVVLMIGGNIPGVTQVGSIALYEEVELGKYASANGYAMILFAITFAILLFVYLTNQRMTRLKQL